MQPALNSQPAGFFPEKFLQSCCFGVQTSHTLQGYKFVQMNLLHKLCKLLSTKFSSSLSCIFLFLFSIYFLICISIYPSAYLSIYFFIILLNQLWFNISAIKVSRVASLHIHSLVVCADFF